MQKNMQLSTNNFTLLILYQYGKNIILICVMLEKLLKFAIFVVLTLLARFLVTQLQFFAYFWLNKVSQFHAINCPGRRKFVINVCQIFPGVVPRTPRFAGGIP